MSPESIKVVHDDGQMRVSHTWLDVDGGEDGDDNCWCDRCWSIRQRHDCSVCSGEEETVEVEP